MEKFWFTFKWTFYILGGLCVLAEIVMHLLGGILYLIPYAIVGTIIYIAEKRNP